MTESLREFSPVEASWLVAMVRNYVQQDDALREGGAVIVPMPDDPTALLVLQKGGDHLMIQVSEVEVRVGG